MTKVADILLLGKYLWLIAVNVEPRYLHKCGELSDVCDHCTQTYQAPAKRDLIDFLPQINSSTDRWRNATALLLGGGNKMRKSRRQTNRKPWRLIVTLFLLMLAVTQALPNTSQESGGSRKRQSDTPVGTWRGESKCMVRPSGCRDEDSVYRISVAGQSQTRVTLSANKIVDGREVNMGTSECGYSPETRVLDCPLPNGNKLNFGLDGDSLSGAMKLADGRLWRKISLRRATEQ